MARDCNEDVGDWSYAALHWLLTPAGLDCKAPLGRQCEITTVVEAILLSVNDDRVFE